MRRENIIDFVQDPSQLDQSSLGELEDLLDSYPWFQTAHLLVAKNHHNIDSIRFHEVLREAAVYAGDRTVLYHLIHTAAPITGSWMDGPEREWEKEPTQTQVRELPDPEPVPEDSGEPLTTGTYQLDTDAIEEYTFTGWFDHFQSVSTGKPAKTEQEDLIDKFIRDSPGIPRGEDVPPSDRDLSQASAIDSDSFMTETLARIYERQGLLKKAIYAYEKLSLKYPEKSTYFATQINRIKSQLEKN